jgi:ABC-type proline/glycine betaine transport system substrate-binding protein
MHEPNIYHWLVKSAFSDATGEYARICPQFSIPSDDLLAFMEAMNVIGTMFLAF